jgi:hypothetical protein
MRVITLDTNKKVISVKNLGDSYVLQLNDIATELGETGQIQQLDGSFITPVVTPAIPQPTVEERLTNIEDAQGLILLKLEGVIV